MKNNSVTILVVDDEDRFIRLVQANLISEGYQVLSASTGKEALKMLDTSHPDLLLLDVMMPGMDGFETCKRIRAFSNMPIVMLTAKGDEESRIQALDLGADDYIVKPFSANELLARVRAVLRRASISADELRESSIQIGELNINLALAEVALAGQKVSLSSTEYRLLLQFARNLGQVISSRELLIGVWGTPYADEKEILWVSISRLRQKLENDPKRPKLILTRSGEGYTMPIQS